MSQSLSSRSLLLPLLILLSAPTQAQVLPDAVTPAIPGVVAGGLKIELLGQGFEGSEGPLGLPDGSLLFTETRAQRIVRIDAQLQQTVYLENSNGANGLALGAAGELIAVQVAKPRVGIVYPAGEEKVFVADYKAKAFVRPNDLVRSTTGLIYFTDSGQATPTAAGAEAPAPAVYVLTPDKKLRQVSDELGRPNGIQLSKDERTLYVADTLGQHVQAFDVNEDGKSRKRRDFAALAGWRETEGTSGADGLAVDEQDRLYVASNAGIEIFTAAGEALGIIPIPVKPQNLAFAGPGKHWLYVVGQGAVFRIPMLTSGIASRAK